MTGFIDEHRARFGVEPICRVLTAHGCTIAPSSCYPARDPGPCARARRDELVLARSAGAPGLPWWACGARTAYHRLRREEVTVRVARWPGAPSNGS